MNEIPIHIKKLVKEYAAGTIKPDDVEVTKDAGDDITKDSYKFTLPTFDVLGEPTGTHDFSVTVESLVSTKQKVAAELDAMIAKVDAFNKSYDDLLAVLDGIRTQKAAKLAGNSE